MPTHHTTPPTHPEKAATAAQPPTFTRIHGRVAAHGAALLAVAVGVQDRPALADSSGDARTAAEPHLYIPTASPPYRPEAHKEGLFHEKITRDAAKSIDGWTQLFNSAVDARANAEKHGATLDGTATADWSANWRGGANTAGSSFRHLFNFNITLELDKLIGWEGGTVFMNFQNQNGEDGSADVGDFQAYSNIDADGRTEVAELWFEQFLADGGVRIKAGKVDANAEYAYVDNGGEFINSSMGFSPTFFVLPTYPDPAMSINIAIDVTDSVYVKFGLFDGALQEGVETGTRGPKTFFGSPGDWFVIGEAGVLWGDGGRELAGRLGVGAWGHTGTFDRFDGGTENGTAGYYVVIDQTLWREKPDIEDDEQGVGVFFQYGYADPHVSEAQHHVGAGVVCVGAFPGRDADVFGFGASYVRFTDKTGAGFTDDAETAIEAFYKAQLLPWVSVKPDIQYIANPGGVDLKDAVVGTVRVEVAF